MILDLQETWEKSIPINPFPSPNPNPNCNPKALNYIIIVQYIV